MEYTPLPEFKDISWRYLAYATSAALLAASVYAFVREIELKQDVPAQIVSQSEIKIQGLEGLVSEIYVQPGSRVVRGAPLFRLDRDFSLSADGQQRDDFDSSLRNEQLQSAGAIYRQRRAELVARLDTAQQNLSGLERERAVLRQTQGQNREMVAEAERKLARLSEVEPYVVVDRIEQARAELSQLRITAMENQSREQRIVSEMASVRGGQAELRAQLALLEAEHDKGQREIRTRFERERQSAVISAAEAGVVSFSNLLPGKTLRASDVAMVIATNGSRALQAALSIPSRRRGFVRVGQTVRLKLDAFPYVRFGTHTATITAISNTTVAESSPSLGLKPDPEAVPGGGAEGDYVAWATLSGNTFAAEGRAHEILPGMRATASVVVEKRTIAEWLFAPIFRMLRG